MTPVNESLAAGYASLSAWADLLDRINVFPVADGDTGTNLRISLAPLRTTEHSGAVLAQRLLHCATGNSGNIAAAFFQEFCQAKTLSDLAAKAASGKDKAWQAIADPRSGTMLSVFDCLTANLTSLPDVNSLYRDLSGALQEAVRDTRQQLPDLERAGVVDSGALAMYVFFDAFFHHQTNQTVPPTSIFELFDGTLKIVGSYTPEEVKTHCVDVVVHTKQAEADKHDFRQDLARLGESVVVVEDAGGFSTELVELVRYWFCVSTEPHLRHSRHESAFLSPLAAQRDLGYAACLALI